MLPFGFHVEFARTYLTFCGLSEFFRTANVVNVKFKIVSLYISEVKAVPLHVWSSPEDSRRLNVPRFLDNGTVGW
jgi:hypothetical protein